MPLAYPLEGDMFLFGCRSSDLSPFQPFAFPACQSQWQNEKRILQFSGELHSPELGRSENRNSSSWLSETENHSSASVGESHPVPGERLLPLQSRGLAHPGIFSAAKLQ